MRSKASICLSLPTQQLFPFLSAEFIFMNTLSMSLRQQKKSSSRLHSTEILISVLTYTPFTWPCGGADPNVNSRGTDKENVVHIHNKIFSH